MWSLGFRGRRLLAGVGIQADFVFLANWTLVHSTSPLTEPDNRKVCSVHRRDTKQNEAQSSAVLLIQINDPHLQMKLVSDRFPALRRKQMRTNEGLCPSGEVINAFLTVLASHTHLLEVFLVFFKFLLKESYSPTAPGCLQFQGMAQGACLQKSPIDILRCKATQMAVLGIYSTETCLKWK